MPVDSSLAFLQVLEKSSLLSPDKLSEVRQLGEKDTDAKSVARTLIKQGTLTKWQAVQLLAGRHALSIGDYALIDQVESGESMRVFVTRHPATKRQALLKMISRSDMKASPDAAKQFVAKVEEEAAAQNREVLDVHRPTDDDERCFVVVARTTDARAASSNASSSASPKITPSPTPTDAGKDSGGGIQIGPIDTGKGPAAAPAVADFAISTGPKRKKKGRKSPAKTPVKSQAKTPVKSPAKASAKASAKAPAEVIAASPAVAQQAIERVDSADIAPDDEAVVVQIAEPPMALLIAGGVVAGLLLLTGVVLTLIFLFRGSGNPTELADAGGTDPQEVVAEDPGGEEADPALAVEDPEFDPEVDPVVAVLPTADDPAEVDPVVPAIDPASPAAADTTESEGSPAPGSPEPPATPPDNPSMTGTETADSSEDTPTANENAAAADSSAGPVDGPTDAVDPAEPPPAKPKPAVPNKKPFADLPKLVALPELQGGPTKKLGSVYIPDGELCFVKLRGGENACKGSQTIGLRNADGGLAERDWEISAKDGDAGTEVKIAHLSVNDKHELQFQWQQAAAEQPVAAYLMNCALSFSCAGESHVATFRQPTKAEGMVVDFEKSVTKDGWTIDSCPEPSSIRLEVTGVQGAKYTVEPAPVMEAANATAWVKIEDGGGMLTLKLETSMRRNLQVSVEPHVQPTPDVQPQKFSERVLKQYLTQATRAQQGLTQTVQMLRQALNAPGVSDNDKKRNITPRLALAESQLTKADTAVKDLQALNDLMTALSGNMKINFRVFYDADSSQVDLLQVGP